MPTKSDPNTVVAPKDKQLEQEANSFRPDRRPFLFGLLANVVLAVLFIGLPYVRARVRASEARHAFGEFAACFLGGKVTEDPGLALPAGEREHFASLVMHGPADWPARCDASLNEISPDEATFLFPSVKQADADTRATIELLRRESKVLRTKDRNKLGHVPGRPLLAFSRLRGAIAMLLDAAGDAASIDRDAITLSKLNETIVATRVPLSGGAGGVLQMHSIDGAFDAHSLDQRGLSWVRVHEGSVDRHRPKRSRLLRALTFVPEPVLIWALSESRCAELEHGCVRRAMGAARLDHVGSTLPEPQWLTAHPPGRPERHVRVVGDTLYVVALDSGPAQRELRAFKLQAATAADADPVGATRLWPLGERPIVDSLLLTATTVPQVLTARVDNGSSQIELQTLEPDAHVETITTVAGTTPTLLACDVAPPAPPVPGGPPSATSARWLAVITEAGTSLTHLGADNTHRSVSLDYVASMVLLHTDDPARDRVKLLCDQERAVLLMIDESKHVLRAQACGNDLECTPVTTLAAGVVSFAGLLRGDDLILATAGDTEHAQARVQRFDALLAPLGTPQTPTPCWEPTEGLCGQPTLTQDRDRVVLAVREQSDLLAIESRDNGASWQPLSGLTRSVAKDTPANASDRSIMDIHRDRKRYAR